MGGVCLSVCPCASPRRHGQLGHGTLESELQPRLVEALAGVPMQAVAAGGWHSASVSGEGPCRVQVVGAGGGSVRPRQDQCSVLRLSLVLGEPGARCCALHGRCWCPQGTQPLPPPGVQG